ncbi:enoyl-CoA hydratase/isomerase family protein [Thalassobaculum sp. OXR-137]|uniref:enoyl-CoA hydratase/isomerase family protein n=1 Tax=Thalassobaculum sp. OXR-137 TaxID=3100173 RepID=UPI002AC9844A|nr:enoyl-CoA hydratase/isomerase family protein [Thalassobaculum sp. OXR-137]WPZ34374.1 enoyl-CoA hydratase/isomerase family protein [Thalassobaculum sp. OXR-137]
MSDPVLSTRDGAVLRLSLNRAERSNALGPDIVEALLTAVEAAPADGVRLIVLAGEGKHFCAGFDLSDLDALSDGDLLLRLVRIETLLQAVYHAPVPTLAVVRGAAMGAGADLVAACRRRIVVGSGRFAFPGAGFGIALGTRRLAGRVGSDKALEIVAGGRRLDQDEALALGLIDAVIDEDAVAGEIEAYGAMATRLESGILARVADLTLEDGRARDMAALVASAARPGLKDRVRQYQEEVKRARDARGR